jgi:hypothetical protein
MPVFAQTRILGAPVLEAVAPSHGMGWLPQRYALRQSVVLGVMLATMWVAAAWKIFV